MRRKTIGVVQPMLPGYRVPFFNDLAGYPDSLVVYSGVTDASFGLTEERQFKSISFEWRRFFGLYVMPCSRLLELLRAETVLHVADFKFISLWLCLCFRLLPGRAVWLHGQGGYKRAGLLHKIIYIVTVHMSTGYICYNKYSENNIKKILPRFLHHKIFTVENTLYIKPIDIARANSSTDIFYIGRVRERCGLETLLSAARSVGLNVRIIGDGDPNYIDALKKQFSNSVFFGKVFDRDEQLAIAGDCLAGAYGGDAGLSVVHYMAFGLPVVVHGDIRRHMGPEPSYVKDEYNGLLFNRGDERQLAEALKRLAENPVLRNTLAANALETFESFRSPTMGEKFAKIMGFV